MIYLIKNSKQIGWVRAGRIVKIFFTMCLLGEYYLLLEYTQYSDSSINRIF